VAVVSITTSF